MTFCGGINEDRERKSKKNNYIYIYIYMFFKYQLIALFIYLVKHTLKYVCLIH